MIDVGTFAALALTSKRKCYSKRFLYSIFPCDEHTAAIERATSSGRYVGALLNPHNVGITAETDDVTMIIVSLSVPPCPDASLHLQPYLHATLPQHELCWCSMRYLLRPAALLPLVQDQISRPNSILVPTVFAKITQIRLCGATAARWSGVRVL